MWSPFRKKEPDVPVRLAQVGAFGKVPKMGDFVRAGGRLTPSFEAWLESGLAWGDKKHREAWPALYDGGGAYGFVFRPLSSEAEPSVLVGTLKPSHDSVGRRFPTIIFGRLPEKKTSAAPHLMPLLLEPFASAGRRVMTDGESATSAADLQKHIDPLQAALAAIDVVDGAYDTWSHGTAASDFWATIYGDERSTAPLVALKSIHEAVAPFANQENGTTTLGIRLPLGSGGAGTAAFWVDAVRRIAGWQSTTPTVFWSLDDRASTMLIQLGTTPASSLAALWAPDPESASVCDVSAVTWFGDRATALRALPREWVSGLQRPGSVSDMLELIRR
jgi:type VI secretion system ImpM family protein